MFSKCSSLSNIRSLQNWDVSRGNNFSYMFYKCSSLSDIRELKNWNLSNRSYFGEMLKGCFSLLDIKYDKMRIYPTPNRKFGFY